MTHVYRCCFDVRGYELSANGNVHDSVLLYYVQQAAFEASADAGYDTRRYSALGTVWVIRQQTIVYLVPLTFGDTVQAKTWVSDVRRVRSHRETELRRLCDGVLVALAQTDWVYIDVASQFPRRIPPEIVTTFGPNGISALDAAPPLPPDEPVNGRSFTYTHRVKSYELDNLRHVNNANYLNWLNQARLEALAQATGRPWIEHPTPLRYTIEYLLPARAGDEVQVHSRVVALGENHMTWHHQIMRGQERLAQAQAVISRPHEHDLTDLS